MIFCFPLLQDDLEKGHVLSVLPDVVRANKVSIVSFPQHRCRVHSYVSVCCSVFRLA